MTTTLPWRFTALEGCPKHGCKLLDKCGCCERSIGILTTPLFTLVCPFCGQELSTGSVEPLSGEQIKAVENVYQNLEFLLVPQGYEDKLNSGKHVGCQLATLRKNKGVSRRVVTEELGFPINTILNLENGGTGRLLMYYQKYCQYLNTSFRELFAGIIVDTTAATKPRQTPQNANRLLAEVNRAYAKLSVDGKRVSRQQIADEIGVSVTTLMRHEAVQARLREIAASYLWTDADLLAEVNRAYAKLSVDGKRVTQQQIADEIGVSVTTLWRYEAVRKRLREILAH
jgi:transcriptional regulator with XRE-family HTH domain